MFKSWEFIDQELALADMLHEEMLEREKTENKCPLCGGDKRECQNLANQNAYEAHAKRCYRSKAAMQEIAKYNDDYQSTIVAKTQLNPEKRKT